MCTNPKFLSNRSKQFSLISDRLLLQVPCGECEECKAQRINDWITRLYFEHLYTVKNGGFVCFPTFTFDNEHLPYINLLHPYHTVDGKKSVWIHHGIKSGDIVDTFHKTAKHPEYISCVDRELWHKFSNSIKTYLSKVGYSCKWFYAWQYGETYGRIHIHAKMHLYPNVVTETFDSHNRKCSHDYILHPDEFLEFLQRTWKHGEVSASTKGFVLEDANKSSRYVSRYAVRDDNWEKEFNKKYQSYLDDYDRFPFDKRYKFFEPLDDKEIRNIRPFVYSSANLGISTILYQSHQDILNEEVVLPKQTSFVKQSLPLYLRRKYFYNIDDNKSYHLSTEPKEIFLDTRKKHSIAYAPTGLTIFENRIKTTLKKVTVRNSALLTSITSTPYTLDIDDNMLSACKKVLLKDTLSPDSLRRIILDLTVHIADTFCNSAAYCVSVYSTLYRGFLHGLEQHRIFDIYDFVSTDEINERIKALYYRSFSDYGDCVDTYGIDYYGYTDKGKIYSIDTSLDAYAMQRELLPYCFDFVPELKPVDLLYRLLTIIGNFSRSYEIAERQKQYRENNRFKDWKNHVKFDNF